MRVGFEPTKSYQPLHAFQACALNHSATSPTAIGDHALDLAVQAAEPIEAVPHFQRMSQAKCWAAWCDWTNLPTGLNEIMRLWAHIVAWAALIVALLIAMRDGVSSLEQETLVIRRVGQIWFEIDPPSLNLAQAVVERYAAPWLWDDVIIHILQLPAVAIFAVIGVAFMVLSRSSRRGGRPFSRKKKA